MIKSTDIACAEALDYLRGQLELSGKTLAKLVRSQFFSEGKVFAFVPENTPSELLYRFEAGGIYPYKKRLPQISPAIVPIQNDAKPIVMNNILQYLQQKKENCCLFEEPCAIPSDPWVRRLQINYVHLNQQMFYFFGDNTNTVGFEQAFTASEGYYFLCALSTLDTDKQKSFVPFSPVTDELLKEFASNIVCFFVRAYDGEGYLQWSRV